MTGTRAGKQVSVVIPTHNRRELLGRTLASVLAQSSVDLEAIVVDDGSSDETPRFLEVLDDDRVRIVRNQPAKGVASARNGGIAAARGEWIAFCDDDDLWAPDKLAAQLHAARETGSVWVYAGAVNVDLQGRVHGGAPPVSPAELLETLPRWNPMPGGCSNVIASREALGEVGGFDLDLTILADWDLWLRLSRIGPPACVSRPLVGYRVHGANMSLKVSQLLDELNVMMMRYPGVDQSGFERYIGTLCLRAGRRLQAARFALRAAAHAPMGRRLHPLRADARAILDSLEAAARRRLGIDAARRQRRYHDRQLASDTNRRWKSEAQRWLEELPEPA
jgi:glycosyltransferase involved in cell wall biosynthesis